MGDGPRDGAGFDSMPDEELMLQAGTGDTDAFEALVRRHERGVVGYFYRLHWDRHRAEDQAQEVFIRLFTHARDYAPTARFTTYMYRIAHNYWVDEIRRAKKERGQVSLDAHDEEGTSLRDLVMDGSDDPRDRARKEEVVDAVIGAVDTLPDEQKAVFVLSEVREMRYSEIAEVLGIPEGTVKSRMHAAVRRLRQRLAAIAPRGRRG
ncbi:MAG: RNA polymerase sigma factor [Planctomycetota bacterium]|jgi:RNA polymerase sigma-70 factor (ECF subfamily)